MLEWEAARYPEGGTYLGPVDFVFNGPDRQFLPAGLGFATPRRGRPSPSSTANSACPRAGARQWLDGTMGFYYRNFADKLPQTLLTRVGPAPANTT